MTLREKIEQEIREHGPMPFSRYMEMCLYDPELGYYSCHTEQFGKAGDFYTSSDVHAVFGRLLARQFEEMWRVQGSPQRMELLELGPGRGLFARDVLDWSEKKFPEFFQALHYRLAEGSLALRQRLRVTLSRALAAGKASLEEGFSAAEAAPISVAEALAQNPCIVFANEFFDALPVEILGPQGKLHIGLQGGRLTETWSQAPAAELEFLDRYSVHPEAGERVEAPLAAQRFMRQLAAHLRRGFLIIIDYGSTRQEQLAGRHRGTVMAYRQHAASANPYEAPGEQDITAHVNFTALAAAAEQNGMLVQPLLTQSQFLMGVGEQNQFADAFEECFLPPERAKVALQLKHLVTPAGMGESFHVLVASKSIDAAKVEGLSGLSFGKTRR
ncbi:MAG TPA: SAM-dependent methyltransferase [Terriglobales bacterium]|nr:SAM-dependent methyltransferase [Terriglobales bacterium]